MNALFFTPCGRGRPRYAHVLLLLGLLFALCCHPDPSAEPADQKAATRIAIAWNQLALDLERHTPGYRAPLGARAFAYVEMAAYESALPVLEGYVSLKKICPGYVPPPAPAGEHHHLPAALNAAYARILSRFFAAAPAAWQQRISRLEVDQYNTWGAEESQADIQYGRAVADAVWAFAQTDSMGVAGVAQPFDPHFPMKNEPGCWQPDSGTSGPLLPRWGAARLFALKSGEITAHPTVPIGADAGLALHTEAMEVFTTAHELDKEAVWIAEFWSDDLPGLTLSPAGRWISIANQALAQAQPVFPKVMETYLKTAWALCNAGIVCWEAKYRYQLLRPDQYIRQHIQHNWAPLHAAPPFPSFPSGHATFGAAAAEVLTAQLGEHFRLTDRTHEGRAEFASMPRSFRSFEQMAEENAFSRVLMGVHYRMDCEEGLRLGKAIGQKISRLHLHWHEAAVRQ